MFTPSGPSWRKSRYSGNFNCVELRPGTGTVSIRDSKNPIPTLDFPSQCLRQLVSHLKA